MPLRTGQSLTLTLILMMPVEKNFEPNTDWKIDPTLSLTVAFESKLTLNLTLTFESKLTVNRSLQHQHHTQ